MTLPLLSLHREVVGQSFRYVSRSSRRSLSISCRAQQISTSQESGRVYRRVLVDHDPKISNVPSQEAANSTWKPVSRRVPVRRSKPIKRIKAHQPDAAATVAVQIDGQEHPFGPITLRDLCSCPRCVDPSTKQKQFYTPDIPSNITAKDVTYGPETVSVTWSNDVSGYGEDHQSNFRIDTLRNLILTGRTTPRQPSLPRALWTASEYREQTQDFDYSTYMADDHVLLTAIRQLHSHGLLSVTGVPEDEESVVRIAERIGPLKTTFYGKTWDVRSVPDAKNVAYTSQNLGFHMDLMYMEQPPHLQLLHCIRSSSAGGASLFSDSFKAADELSRTDEEAYKTLCDVSVEFHYDHPGSNYYHQSRKVMEQKGIYRGHTYAKGWNAVKQMVERAPADHWLRKLTPLDFLESVAWSPPFQGPFKTDGLPGDLNSNGEGTHLLGRLNRKVERWHGAAQKFNELFHRPEAIYERLMRPGECVIFDNRRVLHARRAFVVADAGKERWLRGAYIDKDPYLSKLKILTEQLEGTRGAAADGHDLAEAMSTVA